MWFRIHQSLDVTATRRQRWLSIGVIAEAAPESNSKRHRAPCTVLDARDGHRYTAVAKTETLAFAYFCERRTYDPRAWLCQRRRTGRLTALEKGAGWRTISWYYTAMEYANFRVSMRSPALSGASPICSGRYKQSEYGKVVLPFDVSVSTVFSTTRQRGAGQVREPAGGQVRNLDPILQPHHWRSLAQHQQAQLR